MSWSRGIAVIVALTMLPAWRPALAEPAGSTAADRESLAVADTLTLRFRRVLATGNTDLRTFQLAERILALREPRLPAGHPDLLGARVFHGIAMYETGDFPAAIAALDRCVEQLDAQPGPDSLLLGMALNGLGRSLSATGSFAAARRRLERAVAINDALLGPHAGPIRVARNNLASAIAQGGDLAAARTLFEHNLAVEESMSPLDSVRLGIAVNNLANVVTDMGDLVAGLALYERALALREAALGPNHPRVAFTLNNMGSLAEESGKDSLALRYASRAIDIRRRVYGERHPLAAEFMVGRASILARLGRTNEAVAEALLAERISRECLALGARLMTAANALAYERYRQAGLHVALAILVRTPGADSAQRMETFEALVASRALLLQEFARRRRARGPGANAPAVEREWHDARQAYADLVVRGLRAAPNDSAYAGRLERARVRAARAELRHAEWSAAARAGDARDVVGAREVLAALPPDAALLSYARYSTPEVAGTPGSGSHYAAIVSRAGRDPEFVGLGGADAIDSLVTAWRTQAGRRTGEHDERAFRAAAQALRAAIWDPPAPKLSGARMVFIVPDAALHLVNFATLPAGKAYLIDSGPLLHVLNAERDILPRAGAETSHPTLAIYGGVDFENSAAVHLQPIADSSLALNYRGAVPDCGSLRESRFESLPGAAREISELTRRWPEWSAGAKVSRHSGPEATEEAFKQHAGAHEVIHVATHGFFVDAECAQESEDEELSGNPLLRSGLVMAGANRAQAQEREDGWLTAEEIAALDLSRARWVVLSACGTGVGATSSAEGVFGLRRAFEIAGAGTLITSLWDVEDEATRTWMRALYEARFARHRPAATAVQEATRDVLGKLRKLGRSTHPHTWGAFIATGDWR